MFSLTEVIQSRSNNQKDNQKITNYPNEYVPQNYKNDVKNNNMSNNITNQSIHRKSKGNVNVNFQNVIGPVSIKEFNNLPLMSKQMAMNKVSNLSKINDLMNFLLKFKGLEFQKHTFEIVTSNQNTALIDINKEYSLHISHNLIEFLFDNDSLNAYTFINSLLKINSLSFDLEYPSNSFKSILQQVTNIKKVAKININILIKEIEETDLIFNSNKDINSIKFDSSMKMINSYSFQGCKSLSQVTLPPSLVYIGGHAFSNCVSLKEITIPVSVDFIGNYAFDGCFALEKVTLPSSLTSIRVGTFQLCESLNQVVVPFSVETIEDKAFFGCKSLKDVDIPLSIQKIALNAFDDCQFRPSSFGSERKNMTWENGNDDERNELEEIVDEWTKNTISNEEYAEIKEIHIPNSNGNTWGWGKSKNNGFYSWKSNELWREIAKQNHDTQLKSWPNWGNDSWDEETIPKNGFEIIPRSNKNANLANGTWNWGESQKSVDIHKDDQSEWAKDLNSDFSNNASSNNRWTGKFIPPMNGWGKITSSNDYNGWNFGMNNNKNKSSLNWGFSAESIINPWKEKPKSNNEFENKPRTNNTWGWGQKQNERINQWFNY
ncbi:hypothetical protein M9Y10_024704 [Tritrichomonas musculus]|uniref:Uncharacterized protein n=1 Tax=Tritrichomonas musculus TaxID=1915356 RepID=A0ABR2HB05_9EUKA